MTVIVSVKINDGIVMAADSVSSYASGMTYQHANKIVNLRKGLPIGAMVTGNGGIGSESIETLLKDLRQRLEGRNSAHADWRLDPDKFTVEQVAKAVRTFLFEEKVIQANLTAFIRLRLCGYSAGRPLSEVWEVFIDGNKSEPPTQIQNEIAYGPLWDGEYEALNRIIFGTGTQFVASAAKHLNIPEKEANELHKKLLPDLYQHFVLPDMPIQDAIHLAKFMVETTIGLVKFATNRPHKTVGGPIEIAAITKHEGFKWIQRKHFYPQDLNAMLP